ncbi:MAG TPA: type II secretion system protein GspM, partial [Solirubrobacteraceae bacterium]
MTTRDRTIIALVAVAAALAAFWFLLLAPKRHEASKLSGQVSTQRHTLASSLGQLQTALQAKKSYASNYAEVARLGQAVPSDDNVPSLVFQLDTAAHRSGVDFRGVKLSQDSTTAGTTTAPPAPAAPATGSSSGGSSSSGSSSSGSSGSSGSSSSG